MSVRPLYPDSFDGCSKIMNRPFREYNHNHDPKTGEFSTAGGSANFTADMDGPQWSRDFDIAKLSPRGQRIMIHPKSDRVLVGRRGATSNDSTHAEEFYDAVQQAQRAGTVAPPGKYDDYLKGWAWGVAGPQPGDVPGDKHHPPTMVLYSKYYKDPAEASDAFAHAVKAMIVSGHATGDTIINGLDSVLGMGHAYKERLDVAFPDLFKKRRKAA